MDAVEREFEYLISRASPSREQTLISQLREKLEEYRILHKKNDR